MRPSKVSSTTCFFSQRNDSYFTFFNKAKRQQTDLKLNAGEESQSALNGVSQMSCEELPGTAPEMSRLETSTKPGSTGQGGFNIGASYKSPNPAISSEEELFYDFHKQSFVFSAEELLREPIPDFCWLHLSCIYWVPELSLKNQFGEFDIRGLNHIEKTRFKARCVICNQFNGACISCSAPNCGESFHVECGRRAGLYSEVINSSVSKCQMFCLSHTPLVFKKALTVQERRAREEILKFFRALRRFFKARKITIEASPSYCEIKDLTTTTEMPSTRQKPKTASAFEKKGLIAVRPPPETYLRFLSYQSRQIMLNVKRSALAKEEYGLGFVVQLRKKPETPHYEVAGVNCPTRSIWVNRVPKIHKLWRDAANKASVTVKSFLAQFEVAWNELKRLENGEKLPQILAQTIKGSNDQIEDIEEDEEATVCICGQKWQGELMVGKLKRMREVCELVSSALYRSS